jgi:translocator assembly and maintenance protein 41
MFNKSIVANLIAHKFPETLASWAYGSAVFPQSSSSNSNNMIDLFLVVKDPYTFHRENMKINSHHYSGLSYLFGPHYIELINNSVFPIHFNSHIAI